MIKTEKQKWFIIKIDSISNADAQEWQHIKDVSNQMLAPFDRVSVNAAVVLQIDTGMLLLT